MRGLAKIAAARGCCVTGSDLVIEGHAADNVGGAELVVYTGAVSADNAELVEARRRGIPCIERGEYLGKLAAEFDRVIAVAGTHGKTTTAAMIGCIIEDATLHFGGRYTTINGESVGGVRLGGSLFLTEACEFRRSMLHIKGGLAVITNVDFDHPDCYADEREYFAAFEEFTRGHRAVITCGDDARLKKIASDKVVVTFGFGEGNDYRAVNIGEGGFDVVCGGEWLGRISLKPLGRHNVLNALCAAAAACELGVNWVDIARRLAAFEGVDRRMQRLGDLDGRRVYLDYAHHPDEIGSALGAFEGSKIAAVFQPHTYTRLKSLWERFAASLGGAGIERVIVLPVYAAREKPLAGVGGREFAQYLSTVRDNVIFAQAFGEAREYLERECGIDEVILLLGAGDVDGVMEQGEKRTKL